MADNFLEPADDTAVPLMDPEEQLPVLGAHLANGTHPLRKLSLLELLVITPTSAFMQNSLHIFLELMDIDFLLTPHR